MRWKIPVTPILGTTRVKKQFAFFPRKTDNEYVWLEYVYVVQEFKYVGSGNNAWMNIEYFSTKETAEKRSEEINARRGNY